MNIPAKGKGNPGFAFLCSHPFHLVSLGFGSGLSPVMPGTAGTLFAWIVYDVLTLVWPTLFTPLVWGCICIAGFLLGIKTCQVTGNALGSPDDGSMVWDEIIAFWLIMLFVTPGLISDGMYRFCRFPLFRYDKTAADPFL